MYQFVYFEHSQIRQTFFFFFNQLVTEDKYVVSPQIREASIVIKNTKETPLTLTIHLTSPVVREEMEKVAAGGKLIHQDPFVLFFLFRFLDAAHSLAGG